MEYYRFVTNGMGIYEKVTKEVPADDSRRLNKPDGSWLPKEGEKYPGAVSFWKHEGLEKYIDSGLLNWHRSVVKENIEVVVIDRPAEILYEDEYQIIFDSKFQVNKDLLDVDEFLKKKVI